MPAPREIAPAHRSPAFLAEPRRTLLVARSTLHRSSLAVGLGCGRGRFSTDDGSHMIVLPFALLAGFRFHEAIIAGHLFEVTKPERHDELRDWIDNEVERRIHTGGRLLYL